MTTRFHSCGSALLVHCVLDRYTWSTAAAVCQTWEMCDCLYASGEGAPSSNAAIIVRSKEAGVASAGTSAHHLEHYQLGRVYFMLQQDLLFLLSADDSKSTRQYRLQQLA